MRAPDTSALRFADLPGFGGVVSILDVGVPSETDAETDARLLAEAVQDALTAWPEGYTAKEMLARLGVTARALKLALGRLGGRVTQREGRLLAHR